MCRRKTVEGLGVVVEKEKNGSRRCSVEFEHHKLIFADSENFAVDLSAFLEPRSPEERCAAICTPLSAESDSQYLERRALG